MHNRICAVAMVVCLMLAACSPTPAPTPTASPAAATVSASPRPTVTPAATIAPAPTPEPGALILWATIAPEQAPALQKLIDDLATPLGIQVMVTAKTSDGLQADLRALALAKLATPDLIIGSQGDMGLLQRGNLIQPADDGLDPGAFVPAVASNATFGGNRWGTPLATTGYLLLLYNKKMVSTPPRTTDELINQARAQTAGDTYGLVAGWAEARWFVAWLAGYGGAALDANNNITIDGPASISALNLLKELRASGPPAPSTYAEGASLFRRGYAAMAIDGDWALPRYRAATDTLDLGVAPMPIVPATGNVAAPPLNGLYLMYGSTLATKQATAVRQLGAALAQPAAQERVAAELGLLPARIDALGSQAVQNNQVLAAAAVQLQNAAPVPPTAPLRCAWSAIEAQLPSVLVGEQPQEAASYQMQVNAVACATSQN